MKMIATHIAPDVDALSSVWFIRRFLPGWSNAFIKFVPAGLTLDNEPVDENPEVIHVDTGLGKFDHHQNDENTCAAKKVFYYLKDKNYLKKNLIEPLERMIEVINDGDHFREVFLPNADSDIYTFLLDPLLDGLRFHLNNDQKLVEISGFIFEGILQAFVNKVKAEEEIKGGLIFQTKWGKTIALESDNEETVRSAQKKGFDLAIRKSPKDSFLRIKLSPKIENLNLLLLYSLLKTKDPEATWFYHKSGRMLLNGSAKNPSAVPTKLTLSQVVEIVKKIK